MCYDRYSVTKTVNCLKTNRIVVTHSKSNL